MLVIEPVLRASAPFPAEPAKHHAGDPRNEEIAVICHELRNALAVVSGATRLMQSSADSGGLKTVRLLIERQVEQMSQHIDDLLQPQRRKNHSDGLHHSEHDLRAIARNALEDIRPEMARRRQRLIVKLPELPITVHGDAARLEQAFSNLLINAVKYTPVGGEISLSMERDHDQVRTHVRDSGIGIEAVMLSRIFDMFVQVAAPVSSSGNGNGNGNGHGKGNGNGCGIGLAVVANIVESHGGTVKAASEGLGLGSKFTIALPIRAV